MIEWKLNTVVRRFNELNTQYMKTDTNTQIYQDYLIKRAALSGLETLMEFTFNK